MAGEREYGSRTKRHMNMQVMDKIRSLAQAMLHLQLQNQIENAQTEDKTTEPNEVDKKTTKREKTMVKEKSIVKEK